MNKIIRNLTLIAFLATLAACGGSDGELGGTASDTTDDTTTTDDTEPDPVDDISTEDLGLGNGTGTSYVDGEVLISIGANESLSANGTTSVTVDIVDRGSSDAHFLGVQSVYFLSTCSQVGLAEFSPAELQASATATSTYKDKGCGKETGATDNIVVYIGETSDTGDVTVVATARGTVDVEAANVGAVQFSSASATTLALNGFGTALAPALSEIEFQVIDESGNPMPDRTVRFELDHELGGAALSLTSAITDQEGKVKTILSSGSVSGAIRVKALVDIKDESGTVLNTISTLSTPVAMATSIADQNSSSISLDEYNPAAWNINGKTVAVSVHLGDHYQNPVVDGTSVYFRSTGGIIEPSCETTNGACSVDWISANPRPVDGRVTIVAYTRGAGNFQDANSNGQFDLTESFESFGESFVDANADGTYNPTGNYQPDIDIDNDTVADFGWSATDYQVNVDSSGTYVTGSSNFYEEFIDSNDDGSLTATPSGKYQGVNCSDAAIADGHCAEQMDIVLSTQLEMSASNDAYIEGPFLLDSTTGLYDVNNVATCIDASDTSVALAWRVADSESRRNHLAKATSLGFDTSDVDVVTTNSSTLGSIVPAPTFSVWDALYGGGLTNAEKKYYYLAARGHLLTATVLRPDTFTSVSGVGAIAARVTTVSGDVITSQALEVDLLGPRMTLASNLQGAVTSVDISDDAQNFTLVVQDSCGRGLEEGTLVVSTENGLISAAGSNGGVTGASITSNVLTATVSDSSVPSVLTFTLTTDGTPNTVVDGFDVALRVPHPDFGFDIVTQIADIDIED